MVELCSHPATERARLVTLHLLVRAPRIYPDLLTPTQSGKRPYLTGHFLVDLSVRADSIVIRL